MGDLGHEVGHDERGWEGGSASQKVLGGGSSAASMRWSSQSENKMWWLSGGQQPERFWDGGRVGRSSLNDGDGGRVGAVVIGGVWSGCAALAVGVARVEIFFVVCVELDRELSGPWVFRFPL